jgi:hypothetical protein
MFRFFVNPLGTTMNELSALHPAILEALLERCWNLQVHDVNRELGDPDRRSDVPGRPEQLLVPLLAFQPARALPVHAPPFVDVPSLDRQIQDRAGEIRWHHWIYCYMIENTRVLEVFRRVADMFLHGERLSTLSAMGQRWLWTTEELFLREPPPYSTLTQTSAIRPSLAATRANAYQRMFGMTLNATEGQREFPVAEQANGDFVAVMDELLHEIWQGRSNFANQIGARPTDDAKIAELATRLSDMLRSRRANGTLSREEFAAVAAMSWFHATLETPNHPIFVDLRAAAASPEERLFKIAQQVGVPAHGLAKSYFYIAEPLSRFLIAIEQRTYNNVLAVPALYTPGVPPAPPGPSADTDTILTHWSIIRGRDVKTKKVAA